VTLGKEVTGHKKGSGKMINSSSGARPQLASATLTPHQKALYGPLAKAIVNYETAVVERECVRWQADDAWRPDDAPTYEQLDDRVTAALEEMLGQAALASVRRWQEMNRGAGASIAIAPN
jgi:hypothetical protein